MNKHWIDKVINHKGSLRKALKIKKGDKIPQKKLEKAVRSKNTLLAERANLAKTLKRFKKRK